ncbi:MAG: MBL fold metallo-hydrolase [Methanomicrobiales archaeon]|nr:MBL fold metallo-hydrolase [Methanomicrobiales archaeon]
MILKKITSEGLSHHSYVIGSESEVAIIDPRRDIDCYLDLLRTENLTLKYIFETHKNEDYVIGSLDLARITGAEICHGANYGFDYGKGVADEEVFSVGSLELEIRETPGHTVESISLVLRDRSVSDAPMAIFTGDALFAGDVGRTDFYPERMEEMAAALYDSLWNIIMALGDGVVVYPAHGEGSPCGEAISDHLITTVGYERRTNPLLQKGREEFIRYKVKEHHYFPPYFNRMGDLNTHGAASLPQLPVLVPLSVMEVGAYRDKGAQIVDIRGPTNFGGGFIEGSLSIWREGLPYFIGWMLNYEDPIVLVDDFNLRIDEVTRTFVREGFDNVTGYLSGGFASWSKSGKDIRIIPQWTPRMLYEQREQRPFILDVRDIADRASQGYVPDSVHRYIGELPAYLGEVPRDRMVVTYCDAGFKGNMAATILAKYGYLRLANLTGGFAGWKNSGFPIEK